MVLAARCGWAAVPLGVWWIQVYLFAAQKRENGKLLRSLARWALNFVPRRQYFIPGIGKSTDILRSCLRRTCSAYSCNSVRTSLLDEPWISLLSTRMLSWRSLSSPPRFPPFFSFFRELFRFSTTLFSLLNCSIPQTQRNNMCRSERNNASKQTELLLQRGERQVKLKDMYLIRGSLGA